jgi:insertion element IS1 protein InsB
MRTCCPDCGSKNFKKNGHIHTGKQNHRCKECGRQFVLNPDKKGISDAVKERIKKLLLERISLCGICRAMDVSMTWLLNFITLLYQNLPEDLNLRLPEQKGDIMLGCLEADELWSFVEKKANKQWIWLAIDTISGQVVGFYVGDRSEKSAQKLWESIPEEYRKDAIVYTDHWDAYKKAIPEEQHRPVDKDSGKTSHIERLNCTLRQRCSRLVRKTLSFSKKLANHIGAIKYFICHYNLALQG